MFLIREQLHSPINHRLRYVKYGKKDPPEGSEFCQDISTKRVVPLDVSTPLIPHALQTDPDPGVILPSGDIHQLVNRSVARKQQ